MKQLISSVLFIITLLACQSTTKENYQRENQSEKEIIADTFKNSASEQTEPILSKNPFSKIEQKIDSVILIFFTNIVLERILPTIKISPKGYYQVDMASYLNELDSIGIFDSLFYQNEIKRMNKCIAELEQMKAPKGIDKAGIWTPQSCFPEQMYWLNAQDEPESYKIVSGKILDPKTFSVDVEFISFYDGQEFPWESCSLKVGLVYVNNSFLISSATVIYKD